MALFSLIDAYRRFISKLPYFTFNDITIAVNPYEWLDIYGERIRFEYYCFNTPKVQCVCATILKTAHFSYYTHSAHYGNINELVILMLGLSKCRGRFSKALWTSLSDPNCTNPFQELPAHIYCVSAFAYRNILTAGRTGSDEGTVSWQGEQSILVNGESGAGKTESVKLLVGFLSHVACAPTQETADNFGGGSELVKKVLGAIPLLEVFGNARTSKNDNSSRFGKHLISTLLYIF